MKEGKKPKRHFCLISFRFSVNNLRGRIKILLMNPSRMATCAATACQSCCVNLWRDVALFNLPAPFSHNLASIQNARKWHQSFARLHFGEQPASIFTLKIHSSSVEHCAAPQWVTTWCSNHLWCVSQGSQLALPSFPSREWFIPPTPRILHSLVHVTV